MKIAHVVVKSELAGSQQVCLDILSSIQSSNIKKYLICGDIKDIDSTFVNLFSKLNVEIIELKSLKTELSLEDIKAFFLLYNIFRTYQFDIVHTHATKPGVIARVAARFAGVKKIIHTVHGISFHKRILIHKRTFFFILENLSTVFGHHNITVNKFYLTKYPLVKSKTIYNGINFVNLIPNKEKSLNKIITIGFLGRLTDQKNPLDFIEIIRKLNNDITIKNKFKVIIGGGGELLTKCLELVNTYNLKSLITFEGWVEDKSKFFNAIDILCMPSKWEAFGLVFVEAAYFKIPSVSSDVEGIPEVVKHNETGLIFKDGDLSNAATHLTNLINNPDLINKLGENARISAMKNFSVDKMVDSYKEIYFNN